MKLTHSSKCLILLFTFVFLSDYAAADAAFDACVEDAASANGWEEPAEYVQFECPDAGISSVSGLEEYPNLGTLILSGNNLTSLDISAAPSIFHLNVNNNSLSSLNISGNANLSVVLAANNNLGSLDTSANTSLAVLSLGNNNISSLDLSNNTNLARLFVHNNSLSSLDISNNQGVYEMTAGNNGLTSINLGPSGSLQTLGLANNNLTTVDIRGHGALSYLNVQGNPLVFADYELLNAIAEEQQEAGNDFELLIDPQEDDGDTIEITDANFDQCLGETGDANGWNKAVQYTSLDCSNAGISNVDELFHFTNLVTLNLEGNAISDIELSANTALSVLNLNDNNLDNLDISNNTDLTVLQAANNNLDALDTSANTKLNVLNVIGNNIGSLDFSANSNLGRVFVNDNKLTSLDISGSNGISQLTAGSNAITQLVLGSGSLETLGLESNALTTLDITGHGALNYVNVRGNDLDEDTRSSLTGIAEEQGDAFTLLIDLPPPDEPVPAAVKVNAIGGPARTADIGLGAYTSSGEHAYGTDFVAGDFVTLYGEITPDPVDVGQEGEIYALIQSRVGGKISFSYLNEDGVFVPWDLTITGLGAMAVIPAFEESHEVRIFNGVLQAGIHKITIGYWADGGSLVYMKPITVTVSE